METTKWAWDIAWFVTLNTEMKSQHALHSSLKGLIYKNGDKKSNLVCPGFFLLKDFVFLIAKTSFNLLQKKNHAQ